MTTSVTLFTPAASCSTSWVGTDRAVIVGQRCLSGSLTDDLDCVPSTLAACPYNWKAVKTANSITTCCPGEFSLSDAGWCYSSAGGNLLQGITCAPSVPATAITATYTFIPGVWAQGVSYVGSVATSSATPTVTSVLPSVSVLNTGPPSPLATTSSTSDASSNRALSAGDIAGIVVGSVVAIVLILGLGTLLRRRNEKREAAPEHQSLSQHVLP